MNKQGGISSISGLNFLKSSYKNQISNKTFYSESEELGKLVVIELINFIFKLRVLLIFYFYFLFNFIKISGFYFIIWNR
jgi:hypothetical protein